MTGSVTRGVIKVRVGERSCVLIFRLIIYLIKQNRQYRLVRQFQIKPSMVAQEKRMSAKV